ncbi:MAG: OAM dimerization domain-containing protein [Dehalobacterium sp.]
MNLRDVRPYGDTLNDGMIQLSFTFPVPYSEEAKEAARIYGGKLGLEDVKVVHSQDIGGFAYFVVYGRAPFFIDMTEIKVSKVDAKTMSKGEVETYIKANFGRKLNVVGACIETDAHTVGIDAIMNMKGYDGHKGLESYKGLNALNLGSQVQCDELIAVAVRENADAILVSQVVTQKDIHIQNLTKLVEMLDAEGLREKILLIVGGPRIDHSLAQELGYDAGFGIGTFPEDVASYIVQELKKRQG